MNEETSGLGWGGGRQLTATGALLGALIIVVSLQVVGVIIAARTKHADVQKEILEAVEKERVELTQKIWGQVQPRSLELFSLGLRAGYNAATLGANLADVVTLQGMARSNRADLVNNWFEEKRRFLEQSQAQQKSPETPSPSDP